MSEEATQEVASESATETTTPMANGITEADIVIAEQAQAKDKADKAKAKNKDEQENEEPIQEEVDRLARAKEAADRMSAQRRAQEMAAREAAQTRYMLQQRETEYARLRQEHDEQKARWAKFEADPLTYLRDEKKLPADELARRAVEDADPEIRLKRMQERLDNYEEQIRERDHRQAQERAQAQHQAAQREAEVAFIGKAKDADAYPSLAILAEHRPQTLIREALDIVEAAYKRTGITYSDEEALEYLETVYSKVFKRPESNGADPKSNASATVTQTGSGTQATSKAGKQRTLSGKDAAQSSTLPPNFDELPDKDQKRLMAEMYRRLASK